ncbi:MAG: hypothetical protein HYZ14_06100 [Bacteroidetes bacterium]|nr:hypothetical protein [Bacteroidota bacterium]
MPVLNNVGGKIKIGYNKLIVSLPVLLAGLLAAMAYVARTRGLEVSGETYFLIVGLLVLSVPMYFLPYIVVTDTEIWVNNQFGMPRRRAKISGLQDIRFEKGNILVKTDDFERKLHYNKLLVDAKALRALKQKVEEGR